MFAPETRLKKVPFALDEWLTTQAAIAGMAKTEYITQALEDLRSNAGHTHPQLSPKVSPVDVSIYEEVAALKLRVAKLEQGSTKPIKDKPHFYEGQEITGQSAKTYRLLWNSFEASQKIAGTEFHLSNKLGIACKVIGSSKAGNKKLKVVDCFQGKNIVINDDGTFLSRNEGKLDCIYQELEPTTVEPTSPVEPTNDVNTPTETVIEAPAPLDEPVEQAATIPSLGDSFGDSTASEIVLSRDQLVQRLAKTPGEVKTFGATLTTVGGEQMKASNILNWTSQKDPEGKCWLPTDATREYWVEQLSQVG